jgi:hypothetical protein
MNDSAHQRRAATIAKAPLRASATAALIVGLTLVLAGCAAEPMSSGDARAHAAAEAVAADIGSHSANAPEITLLEMVAWWVPEGTVAVGSGSAVVEPLAWSGESAGSQATIDIRVTVDVEASSSTQLFGESWGPGAATRCFRLQWEQYEEARRSDIECTDAPAPARPTPAPRPELTPADRDRITTIVAGDATAEDVDRALRVAYPQDDIRIETTAADGGVVAAVGIPAERECVLVFRDAAGEVTYPDFRPISLEPGEIGCSTALYTNPPF